MKNKAASRTDHELPCNAEESSNKLKAHNQELQQAQDAGEILLKKYAELYDHSPSSQLTLTHDGVIRGLNLTCAALLGNQRQHLIGRNLRLYVAEAAHAAFNLFLNRVFEDRTTVTWETKLLKGDTELDVFIQAVAPDSSEECNATIIDITERKQSESALNELNRLNLQIIACAQEGIIVYGPDLRYLVWNPYMERVTGVPAHDVLGRHPLELFPYLRDDGLIDMLEKVLAGETIEPNEHPFHVPHNGRSLWGAFTRAPLRDAQGRIIGVIVTVRDITGYKRSEEEREKLKSQLYQAQKMEAVGHLAGGVAHDFNNILTVINGYCALLKMDMDTNAPETLLVCEIAEAANRATNLTHSLLAFSRKQIMRIQNINLNFVVANVEKMLRRVIGEDIELQISAIHDLIHVNVDQLQIEQVLLNLATNARDAMPKGGKLHIKTEYREVDENFIKTLYPVVAGDYAILSISDSGSGMDEATQKKIFEPFFTTKESGVGTGLGLSMVYGIVKQHGGYIYADSSPGKGTTFTIYLPAAIGGYETPEEEVIQELPPSGNVTILVAEDEEPIRKIMKAILTKFGYKVILAVDGQDAVEKFREHQEEIKLVLMDVIMPRKNGKEASSEIAEIKKHTKFLFISGYGADIIKNRGDLEEDADLIMKPAEPNELLKKIKEMLDR